MFSNGWPLSAEAWHVQMLFLLLAATGSELMIVADTNDRVSLGLAMIWTTVLD